MMPGSRVYDPSRSLSGETFVEDQTSHFIIDKQVIAVIHDVLITNNTFSVENKTRIQLANDTNVMINNFTNGMVGQRIHILGNGNMTIINGDRILTNTNSDKLLESNKVYNFTLWEIGGVRTWVEDA